MHGMKPLRQRLLHVLLALALLQLAWLQLSHELDLHAHDDGQACEFCAFTGFLGSGATLRFSPDLLPFFTLRFFLPHYFSPRLAPYYLQTRRSRGPPALH